LKSVVTGSSKQELDTIIEHNFGTDAFDVAIKVVSGLATWMLS
jgi:hypothetical protein